MYSCAISGMSREMMKMDGRGRAECQNWEKKDKMVIFGKVKSQKDKIVNRTCLLQMLKEQKRGKEQGIFTVGFRLGDF